MLIELVGGFNVENVLLPVNRSEVSGPLKEVVDLCLLSKNTPF